MKYKEKASEIEKALGLEKYQIDRIKNAIVKAYHEVPEEEASVDAINAFVAPYIKTPEEAFYAASVILTDVFGAMKESMEGLQKS